MYVASGVEQVVQDPRQQISGRYPWHSDPRENKSWVDKSIYSPAGHTVSDCHDSMERNGQTPVYEYEHHPSHYDWEVWSGVLVFLSSHHLIIQKCWPILVINLFSVCLTYWRPHLRQLIQYIKLDFLHVTFFIETYDLEVACEVIWPDVSSFGQ